MSYGDTRKRDVALVIVILILIIAGLYWFVFRGMYSPTAQAANAELFLCEDNRSITALWLPNDPDKVVLRLSHSPKLYLSGGSATKGSRYTSEDQRIVFTNNGESVSLYENGKVIYAGCKMIKFAEE